MFRIGINVGDVVVDDDDLLGDGVTLLRGSRLWQSRAVFALPMLCRNSSWQDRLRLRGYRRAHAEEHRAAGPRLALGQRTDPYCFVSRATALTHRPSVAVLPFDNLSGQPEETYFSDGITEDIITGFARFRSLFVVARDSSFAFRGKPISPAEIGRQLGVAYLLEGSIRRLASACVSQLNC